MQRMLREIIACLRANRRSQSLFQRYFSFLVFLVFRFFTACELSRAGQLEAACEA